MGNIFSSGLFRKKAAPGRGATPPKGKRGWALTLLLGSLLLFSYANVARQAMSNLERHLGNQSGTIPPSLLLGSSLVVFLLSFATFVVSLSNKEISRPEWDLEWLVTLPVPLATLLRVRLVERTLLNLFGLFSLWPFLSVFSWRCGHGIAAPLVGLVFTFKTCAPSFRLPGSFAFMWPCPSGFQRVRAQGTFFTTWPEACPRPFFGFRGGFPSWRWQAALFGGRYFPAPFFQGKSWP